MSQSTLDIQNSTGKVFRENVNAALQALGSCFAGTTDPSTSSYAIAYMWWLDTGNNLVKQRNTTNSTWIVRGHLDSNGCIIWDGTITSLASAATLNIGIADGDTILVTGTTTITSFGSPSNGNPKRTLIFQSALTLTYSASAIILPGSVSITVAAGDVMEFVYNGSGIWYCTNYLPTISYLKLSGGTMSGILNLANGQGNGVNILDASGIAHYLAYMTSASVEYFGSPSYPTVINSSTQPTWTNGTATKTLATTDGTVAKATGDKNGVDITGYLKALSNSGNIITYTKGNGTTGTITLPSQDLTASFSSGQSGYMTFSNGFQIQWTYANIATSDTETPSWPLAFSTCLGASLLGLTSGGLYGLTSCYLKAVTNSTVKIYNGTSVTQYIGAIGIGY